MTRFAAGAIEPAWWDKRGPCSTEADEGNAMLFVGVPQGQFMIAQPFSGMCRVCAMLSSTAAIPAVGTEHAPRQPSAKRGGEGDEDNEQQFAGDGSGCCAERDWNAATLQLCI